MFVLLRDPTIVDGLQKAAPLVALVAVRGSTKQPLLPQCQVVIFD